MAEAEIAIGRVARPHGLRGQLVIQPASSGSDVLLKLREVIAEQGGLRRTLSVRDARQQGKLLLLAFEGFPDRTAAEALIGAELRVPASELPPPAPGEVYVSSLIGLDAVSPAGAPFGPVVDVESAGNQNWLVVETPTGRRLVPLLEPLVRIDLAARRAIIDAPEGLLDGEAD